MEESLKKSTSERLNELLPQLSKDQLRFVVACQEYPSKKEAAESIGIKPNTAYSWNGNVEDAIQLMKLETVEAARAMNRRAVPKAMAIKIAALDSDNEAIRQKAATELIEWVAGRAPEKIEHTGKDGDVIRVTVKGLDG